MLMSTLLRGHFILLLLLLHHQEVLFLIVECIFHAKVEQYVKRRLSVIQDHDGVHLRQAVPLLIYVQLGGGVLAALV